MSGAVSNEKEMKEMYLWQRFAVAGEVATHCVRLKKQGCYLVGICTL
jgi:hypothetical protein